MLRVGDELSNWAAQDIKPLTLVLLWGQQIRRGELHSRCCFKSVSDSVWGAPPSNLFIFSFPQLPLSPNISPSVTFFLLLLLSAFPPHSPHRQCAAGLWAGETLRRHTREKSSKTNFAEPSCLFPDRGWKRTAPCSFPTSSKSFLCIFSTESSNA